MNGFIRLFEEGGVVIVAIMALSVVLYSRCFKLLVALRRARKQIGRLADRGRLVELRNLRDDLQESFRQDRVALGALIAAAPLLGLLGTVTGMEKTFESLAGRGGDKSMEGLAQGISEVLIATESGLAVAIPALLVVCLAHREVQKHSEQINRLERGTVLREAT